MISLIEGSAQEQINISDANAKFYQFSDISMWMVCLTFGK